MHCSLLPLMGSWMSLRGWMSGGPCPPAAVQSEAQWVPSSVREAQDLVQTTEPEASCDRPAVDKAQYHTNKEYLFWGWSETSLHGKAVYQQNRFYTTLYVSAVQPMPSREHVVCGLILSGPPEFAKFVQSYKKRNKRQTPWPTCIAIMH